MSTQPFDLRVATNNMRALPPNPQPKATLEAAPRASVVLVQEGNLPQFKRAMLQLGGQRVPAPDFVDRGQEFSCVVLYDPTIWEHVESVYPLAFTGHHAVAYTRHLGVTILRHRPTGTSIGFISYHAVTAGLSRERRRMRREGTRAVRRAVAVLQARGLPVIVGCDQNGRRNLFRPHTWHARHGIDHLYGWGGARTALTLGPTHAVKTRSDHDTFVATVHAR